MTGSNLYPEDLLHELYWTLPMILDSLRFLASFFLKDFLLLSFCLKFLVCLYLQVFLLSWFIGNPQESIIIKSHGSSECGESHSMTAQ